MFSREKETVSKEKETLSKEKEELSKENQALSRQLEEVKLGMFKPSISPFPLIRDIYFNPLIYLFLLFDCILQRNEHQGILPGSRQLGKRKTRKFRLNLIDIFAFLYLFDLVSKL